MKQNDILQKLIALIRQSKGQKAEVLNTLNREFFTLLHAEGNFLLKQESAAVYLGDLLNECIHQNAIEMAAQILENNTALGDALTSAALLARSEIYQKIEKKIKSHPQLYPEQYDRLEKGVDLHAYLKKAIEFNEIDFVKMLLKKYAAFYKTRDNPKYSITQKIFKAKETLGDAAFWELYQTMMEAGYPDLDDNDMFSLVESLIYKKDKAHLIYLLENGKNILHADQKLHFPQFYMNKGKSAESVAEYLLNNKFTKAYYETKIENIKNKLSELITQYALEKNINIKKEIKRQFDTVLHAENNFFIQHAGYKENACALLKKCMDIKEKDMQGIVDKLLETPISLSKPVRLLDHAVNVGNIEIYQKIEEKIKNNPERYPDLYARLEQNSDLDEYLRNAIAAQEIDMAKMLLSKYPHFYNTESFKKERRNVFLKTYETQKNEPMLKGADKNRSTSVSVFLDKRKKK